MRRLVPRVLGYLRPHRRAARLVARPGDARERLRALEAVAPQDRHRLGAGSPARAVRMGRRVVAAGASPRRVRRLRRDSRRDRRARRAEQLHHDRHRPADGGRAARRSLRASAPPVARLSQPGPRRRSPLPGHRRHAGAADPHDELPVSRRDRAGDARGHGRDHARARLEADAPVARRLPAPAPRHRAARLPRHPRRRSRARARERGVRPRPALDVGDAGHPGVHARGRRAAALHGGERAEPGRRPAAVHAAERCTRARSAC